ncbi:MAG TPA: PIN domain-containing protein [candidate division Zixibacteria bacterium]|nr:DUF4935 domain-containing protein [candidate division Zixibacteria bacterium]MDD4918489.1 PIN domain-containing protein [candidate division Zixibacteria bacterium]MDM7971816.1 PIN domain-containing protein [candidate division Zixibacteria bacterium]HOD65926.1 PIN domain-containing protein [candidate division Zixibacteria bacterium]HPM37168.1 PIN domain-containing protein [candidate division Zixibacteria bacterium]
MYVVLDTNILMADYLLRGRWFTDLRHFLRLNNGKLVIPRIVLEETVANYGRDYKAIISEAKRLDKRLKSLSKRNSLDYERLEQESNREMNNYREFLLRELEHWNLDAASEKPPGVDDIITAVVSRRKPFKENGEGIGDYLLWRAVTQVATNSEPTVLITNDTSDFGNQMDPVGLHDALIQELGENAPKVSLYRSIQSFIEIHYPKPPWATEEYLRCLPGFQRVVSLVNAFVKRMPGEFVFPAGLRLIPSEPAVKSFYVYQSGDDAWTTVLRFEVEASVEGLAPSRVAKPVEGLVPLAAFSGNVTVLASVHCEVRNGDIRLVSTLEREVTREDLREGTLRYIRRSTAMYSEAASGGVLLSGIYTAPDFRQYPLPYGAVHADPVRPMPPIKPPSAPAVLWKRSQPSDGDAKKGD